MPLGENPDIILAGDPNPGTWGMVTQCYFWASQGNPVALLGDAFATEELGFATVAKWQEFLRPNTGIPRQATNFWRVHGSEDVDHFAAAAAAIEWYAGDRAHYADIDYAVTTTYRYYGQLFTAGRFYRQKFDLTFLFLRAWISEPDCQRMTAPCDLRAIGVKLKYFVSRIAHVRSC